MKDRIYQLDILRFLAAFGVLLFHFTFITKYDMMHKSLVDYSMIYDFTKYGHLGVHLFFIISGFVIFMSAENRTWREFLKSRLLRLFPVYWLCVTITYIITSFSGLSIYQNSFFEYIINLTMLNGFVGVQSIDGVYWSLMIELKFYILIGILVYFRHVKHIRKYLWIWTSIIIFSRYIIPGTIISKALNYGMLTGFAPLFISGILFYLVRQNKKNVVFDTILLLINIILTLMFTSEECSSMSVGYNSLFSPFITGTIIILFFIIFGLFSLGKLEFLNKRYFYSFGMITYALYLLHQHIGYIIVKSFDSQQYALIFLVFVTVIFFVFSFAITRFSDIYISPVLKKVLNRVI